MLGIPGASYPVLRDPSRFNGPYGISGADAGLGLRTEGRGIVLYVDDTHPRANDSADNWGTNPLVPKATIQSAIDSILLVEGSLIVVAGTATLVESAVIANSRPEQCTILGVGNPQWGPTWTSAAAGENALTIRQAGWTIAGIRFNPPSAAAAVRLEHDGATTASDRTRIVNCDFDGLWTGFYGISSQGQPDQVFIQGCRFHEMAAAGAAAAIYLDLTPWASPYMWVIEDCLFRENENHILQVDQLRGGYNWVVRNCVFTDGQINTTTVFIDMRGGPGGGNTFTGNVFNGDYSNTGGYYAHAANPGNWIGNVAEDILEAEVGDNGFTIAIPAA